MLLVLLAAAAAPTVDPAAARVRQAGDCNPGLAQTVTVAPAQRRKLGELPPGMVQLAVDKRVAGCSVTVLPQRDANGDHVMMRGSAPRMSTAHDNGSARERGPKRQR